MLLLNNAFGLNNTSQIKILELVFAFFGDDAWRLEDGDSKDHINVGKPAITTRCEHSKIPRQVPRDLETSIQFR
jgi:hypothetical protein